MSSVGGVMQKAWNLRSIGTLFCLLSAGLMSGCVAQQADLKSAERRFKESNEALAKRGAQQRQELEELRGEELPKLRGELERAQHQAQEIQKAQDDLRQRSAVLEQQTKKLEQLSGKLEAESTNRYNQVRESLNAQDVKNKADRDQLRMDVNNRLDEINRQMDLLRKDIIEAVQKTNSGLVKSVDAKLDEQRKTLADNQARTDQLSGKFTQFSQALTGFRESLTTLGERVGQEEQANKALAAKVEADTKASTAHINETTKAMSGHLGEVNKSVTAVAQKLATRLDEQDHRLEALSKAVDQVAQDGHTRGGNNKAQTRQQPTKSTQRSSLAPAPEPVSQHDPEPVTVSAQEPEHQTQAVEPAGGTGESPEPASPAVARAAERSDKVEYERLLAFFRNGNLEEARQGFSTFLTEYPNSDLAPNARYWLGESHYGKKDYKQAIDSYDRVELDYPQSEKVPAAILKKGYAYLALKDKKRASSAFKQVVTLYPKSPEAGKAYDKLSQLKDSR
ncbi:MAG TPA: tol-pal system protein YbgF [Nitrospira sp.]|nr:tol-pal system protein YbgF [Nitrospira sp.]